MVRQDIYQVPVVGTVSSCGETKRTKWTKWNKVRARQKRLPMSDNGNGVIIKGCIKVS